MAGTWRNSMLTLTHISLEEQKGLVGLGVEARAVRALQGSCHIDLWGATPQGHGHGKRTHLCEAGDFRGQGRPGVPWGLHSLQLYSL